MNRLILDLCAGTGSASEPYKRHGYEVRRIDLPEDVRLVELPDEPVHGIIAAPPCTHLAGSGARWWNEKGEGALLDALSIADACVRLATFCRPKWWVLENPIGRLSRFYGPPRYYFDPFYFGDPYPKRTALWGEFNIPRMNPVVPTDNRIHTMSPGPDRAKNRSITPEGFARLFCEANP